MKILFDTLEEKADYIEEHAEWDEDDETEMFVCPICKTKYEDFDMACECCLCSREEIDEGFFIDEEETDDDF